MEFKTKLDKDRSCIKVYPQLSRNADDKEIKCALSDIEYEINRHIDNIASVEQEIVKKYIGNSSDTMEYDSLFEALLGELSTDIYGYYRYEYTHFEKHTDYADTFAELCEAAYKYPVDFKMCDSGSDKLTEDQEDFIQKIIKYKLKQLI